MTGNDTLVAFTLLLVMIITVLVGVLAYWEFSQLRALRQELQQFQISAPDDQTLWFDLASELDQVNLTVLGDDAPGLADPFLTHHRIQNRLVPRSGLCPSVLSVSHAAAENASARAAIAVESDCIALYGEDTGRTWVNRQGWG